MAVTMVIGNDPSIHASLLKPGYTIASVIANEFTEATGDLYQGALVELGLVSVLDHHHSERLRPIADPGYYQERIQAGLMGRTKRRNFVNNVMLALTGVCTFITVSVLFVILGFLVWNGFRSLDWNFFTKLPLSAGETGGGLANAIVGSAITILIAVVIGVPVGFLGGIYLAEFGGKTFPMFVRYTADLLNGVPSIVIGIFAWTVIVVPMHTFSAWAGGFALSLMMIPIGLRSTEHFLRSVPNSLREGSLALGASKAQDHSHRRGSRRSPGNSDRIDPGRSSHRRRNCAAPVYQSQQPILVGETHGTHGHAPSHDLQAGYLRLRRLAPPGLGRRFGAVRVRANHKHSRPLGALAGRLSPKGVSLFYGRRTRIRRMANERDDGSAATARKSRTTALSKAKLKADNLDFFYGTFQALHDINLEVPEKHITALIGPSGCGKSTFLRTLNRINETIKNARYEGQVLLDGQNVLELDVTNLRRRVGMVFQRPNPFPKSIFDNVAYGLRVNGLQRQTIARATRWSTASSAPRCGTKSRTS